MDDTRQLSGCTRKGSVENYARRNFVVPTPFGHDVIYDNTLPVEFDGNVMPAAVIRADDATSADSFERTGGLRALDKLRWKLPASH